MTNYPRALFRIARGVTAGILLATIGLANDARANSLKTTNLVLVTHDEINRTELRRVANRAESDLALVDKFIGADGDLPRIRVHLYSTLESKGLDTGYTLPVHAFAARGGAGLTEIHAVVEGGFDGALANEIATIVLRHRLGHPRTDILEMGLSVLMVDDWRGRGPLYWAARLAELEDLHVLAPLVDNRALHRRSRLVMRPVAGAFVSFLMKEWGKPQFLERYAAWVPGDDELAALEPRWSDYLRSLRSALAEPPGENRLPEFQRGFCHAHEGYQIHNGYMSRKSDEALAELASFGTNAVSITPFTYMRSANRPTPFPFSSGAGSENDESVIHATLAAKRLGMTVMLKPHVWLGGSWPGEVEMTSPGDWTEFFEHYYRWMRHYALLAEMYDVDILCIGVELSKTTMAQVEHWRSLIRRLRTVYRGRLTYAANWGEEFENTTIWRDLDFIGVSCYYPLSEAADPTDSELIDGVNEVLSRIDAVAEAYDKPAIITEVGFTSGGTPWVAPYKRQRGVAVDTEAQARCYELFFRGLVGRTRCVGVYWWKWPSYLEYGGLGHSGFTPNGKPAEDIVRRWYGEILSE